MSLQLLFRRVNGSERYTNNSVNEPKYAIFKQKYRTISPGPTTPTSASSIDPSDAAVYKMWGG